MKEDNVELVRGLYGFDWIGLGSREDGRARLVSLIAPDFRARVSPEVGERELKGVDGFMVFVEAMEQDFGELRYTAERVTEIADGVVVVEGTLEARGRASGIPLASGFSHLWKVGGGQIKGVDAFLDREAAERSAE